MAISTASALTLGATALSTGMGVYSSLRRGKAQAAQLRYQADAARQNRDLAEQRAGAQRRQGYETMIARRQETASLIGRQRAAGGASGAAVDVGSHLDVQADTAARGEIDAINAYNQGIDAGYNDDIQARDCGQRSAAYDAGAGAARRAGHLNAMSSALGGIAELGSTWPGFKTPADAPPNTAQRGSWLIHPDRRWGS